MAYFFTTTIGKKLLVSITGLFLMLFLLEHLMVNMLIVIDDTGELFNRSAHFLETNPIISVIEPILFIGLILHILITIILSIQNKFQRDINHSWLKRYKMRNSAVGSAWTSRNMLILGIFILAFLIIHLNNFFWKMKFTGHQLLEPVMYDGVLMKNAYALVVETLSQCQWTVIVYVIGAIALGLHLHHGVWSAFQSIGLSNKKWQKILNVIGILFSVFIGAGFAFIPLYIWIAH